MTNLQKATQLISDILKLELGVGDIVELDNRFKDTPSTKVATIIDKVDKRFFIISGDFILYDKSNLKLKQRNITAEDVLKAFQIVRKFHTTLELSNKGYLTYWESTTDITKQEDWILGKSLFDQKNEELYKLIVEVLK